MALSRGRPTCFGKAGWCGIASSPCRKEDEPRLSPSGYHSLGSPIDVSFRSSVGSSPSTPFSLVTDVESDDGDGMYPTMQSEHEEIPSFRYIASPLQWWKTRKRHGIEENSLRLSPQVCKFSNRTDPSKSSSPARRAAIRIGELRLTRGTEMDLGSVRRAELVHLDDVHPAFKFEDLMGASREVLENRFLWTTYKVRLEDGTQVAVKRLPWAEPCLFMDDVNVLEKIRHPNVLAPRAYCLGGDILVYDYMPKGTLSAFLHARDTNTPISWPSRVNIAVGITRGLRYLHTKKNMVHENLTSGNILLDKHADARIANYGLSTLKTWASGYHVPELLPIKNADAKTDVYNLGLILLELLTGQSPKNLDLLQWVASFKEEQRCIVFDQELMSVTKGTTRHQLLNTLKLALRCMDPSPAARPDVQQVLQQLNKIKSDLAGARDAAVAKGGRKPRGEGRTAAPSEDGGLGTSETSTILANDGILQAQMTETIIPSASTSHASDVEDMPTPRHSSLQGNLKEGEISTPTPVDENVCSLSSIDWAGVSIEVQLKAPTSPPLISSVPDLMYQRYFQNLYDLAHRSPPLPSNVLEVQLNIMLMGLHSLGYPVDTWLKAATLVLVFAKKQEYLEQQVKDYMVQVEVKLEEFTSAVSPIKEEISRTRSNITVIEQKQEKLDATIAELEDQVALLRAQREELVVSLNTSTDELVVAEAKMESMVVDMDSLNQQFSAVSALGNTMLHKLLPSLDEAFDSSFQEILNKKF